MSFDLSLDQSHTVAMFERTQHVDRFNSLERRLREPGEFAQEIAAEWNHANLLEN